MSDDEALEKFQEELVGNDKKRKRTELEFWQKPLRDALVYLEDHQKRVREEIENIKKKNPGGK